MEFHKEDLWWQAFRLPERAAVPLPGSRAILLDDRRIFSGLGMVHQLAAGLKARLYGRQDACRYAAATFASIACFAAASTFSTSAMHDFQNCASGSWMTCRR